MAIKTIYLTFEEKDFKKLKSAKKELKELCDKKVLSWEKFFLSFLK